MAGGGEEYHDIKTNKLDFDKIDKKNYEIIFWKILNMNFNLNKIYE